MITFVVDRIVDDRPWPTLQAYPKRADKPWVEIRPYTQPSDLIAYCREFEYEHTVLTVDQYSDCVGILNHSEDRSHPELINSYYTIHIGFFDHTVDYIELLPETVRILVRENKLRILFYYHEGDNPEHIHNRLTALCDIHAIEHNSYIFVTGNTAVENIPNFVHFPDHELLFYLRNKNTKKILKNHGSLMRRFTSLVRTHKWWRATALADLYRRSLLDDSYWSYNTDLTLNDCIDDCAIEIDTLGIRSELNRFISNGPYRCDELTSTQHNDHSITVMEHYENSLCNIIFETVFDADGSGGTFLTEKTFKPIKYAQPFVIVGPAGSLQLLRDLGYRTFDDVIDTSYDTIHNNTGRWLAVVRTLTEIAAADPDDFRAACRADALHNQQVFLASKWDRLNMLFRKINKQ